MELKPLSGSLLVQRRIAAGTIWTMATSSNSPLNWIGIEHRSPPSMSPAAVASLRAPRRP